MSAAISMRALCAVKLGERTAFAGTTFTTNPPHAAQLIREAKAVLLDERDIARIAGREHDLQRGSHRRIRGYFGT